MISQNKIYFFPDKLLEKINVDIELIELDVEYFKNNSEKFRGANFFVRGITNNKYCNLIRKIGGNYLYIDTGYFGNLNQYYNSKSINIVSRKLFHRIVLNDMQLNNVVKSNSERYNKTLEFIKRDYNASENIFLKPWKKAGNKIIICPPSEKVCSVHHFNIDDWIENTVKKIKKYSDREIVIRKKPHGRTERFNNNPIQKLFDDDVFILVSYNSIAATEAIIHGIPILTLGKNAAFSMGLKKIKDIEKPIYPERKLWLNNLANEQFHIEEIQDGTAWKYLQQKLKV